MYDQIYSENELQVDIRMVVYVPSFSLRKYHSHQLQIERRNSEK